MILISFCTFLILFTFVGIASFSQSKKSTQDYLLAGRNVPAWLVGLSAVATNNSGYMFTGMIGFTYAFGWSSVWLMIGWLLGDFVGSLFVHKKLRVATHKTGAHTFAGVLSQWNGTSFRILRLLGGLISIVFLGAYAAAQLNAGSKALHILFGWDLSIGAIVGSVIVIIYCFSGGIRASIWTDAAQSIVMILAMALLFVIAMMEVGGFQLALEKLRAVKPSYMNWFPENMKVGGLTGPILFIMGWMFAGFAVVGQPHIMVRFMTINDPENMNKARLYYYIWFTLFYAITIGVGLMARLLLPEIQSFDAELALPTLSVNLLNPILVGLMLAGLFAATMSTADSLILSCSASLTHDLFPKHPKYQFLITKIGTILVTLLALWIALAGNKNVFELVLYAWAILGAAFGPLIVVYCFNHKPNEALAVMMLLGGIACIFVWKAFGLDAIAYEVCPAMLTGLFIFFVGKKMGLTLKVPEKL